ncbi:MAG: hypothetical protein WC279_11645 [Sulfurimonas sp.]|jgi:hypothetical protein|uniref:hypothetical protein n=1 Tax=Sulfurimonas sp. TaxID=2022749 RepID=UPI001BBFB7E7|nr:hypothetical protein [Sulfurimonas sp.]MDX9756976.1 hypothetical protein [Sulfurimonas sp.]
MSDILIKNEINKLVKESGFSKNPKMLCSIMRVFKMRYSNVDDVKVYTIANELLR